MNREFKVFLLLIFALLLTATGIRAEIEKVFTGSVEGVDCEKGEIKVQGRNKGYVAFRIGEKTEFRNIKGCKEIKEGGFVLIRYAENDGRTIANLIKYRPAREKKRADLKGVDRSLKLFLGWIGSIDCEEGLLTLHKIDDRSKTDSFMVDKDTVFLDVKGCSEIRPNSIVAVFYEKDNDKNVIRSLRPMLQERK